ncbi:MAG: T9SS type A sorting domain-containing protein [Candidatus Azobacteroides sp.]|nr:T9SS type A sorting domain-containing protein [Candidatus Azobacteroides sp.]
MTCTSFHCSAQEYINDTFQEWSNTPSGWNDGTQTIACIDGETRTFSYTQCTVANMEISRDCTDGAVLVRNSNNGWLVFPKLPNIGKITIAREGKTVDKNARFNLQVLNETTKQWSATIEQDGTTATSGCEQYSFNYTSEDSVQIRLVCSGNSGTRLYWIYVEGLEGGSGIPYVPADNVPLPDPATVALKNDKASLVAFQTLTGVAGYGWDPVNRGIYINWHREYPNRINSTSAGDYEERNTATRHDSQNDIRALQHFYWFKKLHDNTPYFDYAIRRILPTVKSRFARPSSPKGWMYYVLLRLRDNTDKPDDWEYWNAACRYWAGNVYNMIDPELGIYYNTDMGDCDCGVKTVYLDKAYRVDHQVEAGAALVHAGITFGNKDWIDAGYRQVQVAYEQTFVEQYGLFGRIYLLGKSGYTKDANGVVTNYDYSAFTNKIWDGQAKLGEISEEADALIRAAGLAAKNGYTEIAGLFEEIAGKMLTGLDKHILHDKTYGGFYQAMYVADSGSGIKAGYLSGDKKEMRQASLLGTYNLANRLIGPDWYAMEKEMYDLLTTPNTTPPKGMFLPDVQPKLPFNDTDTINAYPKYLAGYSYQLDSNWDVYKIENWVSNESNSLVLLGLLEYLEAVQNGYSNPLIHSTGINTPFNDNQIRVFVNDNTLNISGAVDKVKIFNIFGQTVDLLPAANEKIDISNYPSGIYILQATTPSGKIAQTKFLKK